MHNFGFLEVNFQPKCLCRFQETGDYFLWILVVVCHKGSVVSKHELMYQNISGLSCRLKLTGIEQVCPQSALCPYSLGEISEGIRQDQRKKKSRTIWWQEHNPVSLYCQSQMVLRVRLLR